MLSLHPRLVARAGTDADEDRVCYCVVAACVALLLFVVLAAAVSVAWAGAAAGAVALLLGILGWLAPAGTGRRSAAPPQQQAVPVLLVHHRCACGLSEAAIPALPTFAYRPPAAAAKGADDGGESAVLCAVCLDDVQAGEMVRQLPACSHLFHADCVDAWLRAHRTCPLCRCDLSPRNAAAKQATATAAAESSDDALPPV